MMTSSNGNIFRVTGHLCGNSPVTGEFPVQRLVTRSFDVFFDPRLNKRLSKQSLGWEFETLSCPLWRHCNDSCATIVVVESSWGLLMTWQPFVTRASQTIMMTVFPLGVDDACSGAMRSAHIAYNRHKRIQLCNDLNIAISFFLLTFTETRKTTSSIFFVYKK